MWQGEVYTQFFPRGQEPEWRWSVAERFATPLSREEAVAWCEKERRAGYRGARVIDDAGVCHAYSARPGTPQYV